MTNERQQPPQHQSKQPGIEAHMHPRPQYVAPHYQGSNKLAGKVALITGGDSGIGRAIACAFALEGADIIIHYLNEHEDAEETKQFIESTGSRCWLLPANLQTNEACKELVNKALKLAPQIDILVNNIAEQHPKDTIEEISCEQLEETFKTNFFLIFI